jgi:hypothetical protein
MRIGNRNFLEHEIQLIQEMTTTYKGLSRKELAYTICENLNWKNEAGNLKVDSCLVLLKKLQTAEKINLNPLQKRMHIENGMILYKDTIILAIRKTSDCT